MNALNLGREPVAIITVIMVALGAINTQIVELTPTVHNLINVALIVLGAALTRSAVTPAVAPVVVVKAPAPPTPPAA